MITVKAFDKGLVCREFQYEIGKAYEIPPEKVEMCVYGFHASAHCDISETVGYYPNVTENEYALVDIHVIDTTEDKVVGDRITILRKLESLDELISYDKTGLWCYEYAKSISDPEIIKQLQNAVIEKDSTGKVCYYFARDVIKDMDIKLLQDEVLKKDKTGEWCYLFARLVERADNRKLENAVIEKDQTGEWCTWFAKFVKGADISKLQQAVIEKDQTGEWLLKFARNIAGANGKLLCKLFIDRTRHT